MSASTPPKAAASGTQNLRSPKRRPVRMREKVIVRVITKALIPFILLFALYVQFHGDYGPGGGFQAGVIFAAAIVLYGLVFGLRVLVRLAPINVIEVLMASGVLIFGGVGVWSLFAGGNFLDYSVLDSHDPKHGQHLGIILVEAGVGITVTASLIAIFYAVAGRRKR